MHRINLDRPILQKEKIKLILFEQKPKDPEDEEEAKKYPLDTTYNTQESPSKKKDAADDELKIA